MSNAKSFHCRHHGLVDHFRISWNAVLSTCIMCEGGLIYPFFE